MQIRRGLLAFGVCALIARGGIPSSVEAEPEDSQMGTFSAEQTFTMVANLRPGVRLPIR
ncbi:MAG TPA: hypothetical protein VKU00_01640 [Chthonomonadaceae bacterium]|nr:hypothetical protein [Chthonomonadaceae bacterium]